MQGNEEQFRALEEEYQQLLEEQRLVDEFESQRVAALEREVAYFEGQLIDREREMRELDELFRIKLQERKNWELQQSSVVAFQPRNFGRDSNSTTRLWQWLWLILMFDVVS